MTIWKTLAPYEELTPYIGRKWDNLSQWRGTTSTVPNATYSASSGVTFTATTSAPAQVSFVAGGHSGVVLTAVLELSYGITYTSTSSWSSVVAGHEDIDYSGYSKFAARPANKVTAAINFTGTSHISVVGKLLGEVDYVAPQYTSIRELLFALNDGGTIKFFEGQYVGIGVRGVTGPRGFRGPIGPQGYQGPASTKTYTSAGYNGYTTSFTLKSASIVGANTVEPYIDIWGEDPLLTSAYWNGDGNFALFKDSLYMVTANIICTGTWPVLRASLVDDQDQGVLVSMAAGTTGAINFSVPLRPVSTRLYRLQVSGVAGTNATISSASTVDIALLAPGEVGPAGPTGNQGPDGPPGVLGPQGIAGVGRVFTMYSQMHA